jgi:anti-sigma factor RsiW
VNDECTKFLPKIHEWVEGCADEETSLLAQLHLRSCHRCREIVKEWQIIAQEIKLSIHIPAPEGFEERLKRYLDNHDNHQLLSWRELAISWSLTAFSVAASALWFGISLADVVRAVPQWIVGAISWSTLPVQWLQQFWDLISRWA